MRLDFKIRDATINGIDLFSTNVPSAAGPYPDTPVGDSCHEMNLAFGITSPEMLPNDVSEFVFRLVSASAPVGQSSVDEVGLVLGHEVVDRTPLDDVANGVIDLDPFRILACEFYTGTIADEFCTGVARIDDNISFPIAREPLSDDDTFDQPAVRPPWLSTTFDGTSSPPGICAEIVPIDVGDGLTRHPAAPDERADLPLTAPWAASAWGCSRLQSNDRFRKIEAFSGSPELPPLVEGEEYAFGFDQSALRFVDDVAIADPFTEDDDPGRVNEHTVIEVALGAGVKKETSVLRAELPPGLTFENGILRGIPEVSTVDGPLFITVASTENTVDQAVGQFYFAQAESTDAPDLTGANPTLLPRPDFIDLPSFANHSQFFAADGNLLYGWQAFEDGFATTDEVGSLGYQTISPETNGFTITQNNYSGDILSDALTENELLNLGNDGVGVARAGDWTFTVTAFHYVLENSVTGERIVERHGEGLRAIVATGRVAQDGTIRFVTQASRDSTFDDVAVLLSLAPGGQWVQSESPPFTDRFQELRLTEDGVLGFGEFANFAIQRETVVSLAEFNPDGTLGEFSRTSVELGRDRGAILASVGDFHVDVGRQGDALIYDDNGLIVGSFQIPFDSFEPYSDRCCNSLITPEAQSATGWQNPDGSLTLTILASNRELLIATVAPNVGFDGVEFSSLGTIQAGGLLERAHVQYSEGVLFVIHDGNNLVLYPAADGGLVENARIYPYDVIPNLNEVP